MTTPTKSQKVPKQEKLPNSTTAQLFKRDSKALKETTNKITSSHGQQCASNASSNSKTGASTADETSHDQNKEGFEFEEESSLPLFVLQT
jgi:hypothetical protein